MSNLIFPNYLPGILFTPRKAPTFNTGVHPAVTGKESRLSYRAYPLYQWELSYELLRDYADGRVNYVPYSMDLTQWTLEHGGTGFQPILVPNSVAAPDGTLTADRLILNQNTASGGNFSQAWISVAPAPVNTVYTYSIWAKTNDGSTKTVQLIVYNGAGGIGFTGFATVTGTWQRFSVTTGSVFNNGGTVQRVYFALNGASTAAYGDFAVWGAQLELGSTMTAFIPTNGAAVVAGDLKTMFGLFSQMLGQQDTFLYQDPDFNTVTMQPFATGNGTIASFQLTAVYQPGNNAPAPFGLGGLPELIQSVNGAPTIYTLRYGSSERLSTGSRTNLALNSQFARASPPTNGALTQTAGGALGATTYFVKCTATRSNGLCETLASAETSLAVSANNVLNVAAPSGMPGDATGWNVYVSTTTGTETKQNATPIAVGTAWVEPTSGLIAGGALPGSSSYPTSWGIANAGAIFPININGPDGTATAAKFQEDTSTNIFSVQQGQGGILTANARYTHSVWLKYGSCQYVALNLDDGSANGAVALFDLLNGAVVGVFTQGTDYFSLADAQISGPYANGFYRCSISGQFAGTTARLAIVHHNSSTPAWYPSFTGTSRFTYIWGDQLESGVLPTALIPTTTASATNGGSDYSIGATNIVTPAATLANGVQWAWSGSFYYRNRFGDDAMDFAEFLYQFWELKTLKMQQVKL